jgi:hypothetical protein
LTWLRISPSFDPVKHLRFSVVLSMAALLCACEGETGGGGACDPTAPELRNLGLSLESWDMSPGSTAGAFTFDADNPDAPFVAFGADIDPHLFVNIEFKPRPDAEVLSPIDGIVVTVFHQVEDGDYEIHLRTHESSCHLLVLDHVKTPTVAEGDAVSAGEVLGTPGDWSIYSGQFEIQINDDGNDAYVCPVDLVAADQRVALEAAVSQLMMDWEALKNDTSIFDEAAMAAPGCLATTIPYDALPD